MPLPKVLTRSKPPSGPGVSSTLSPRKISIATGPFMSPSKRFAENKLHAAYRRAEKSGLCPRIFDDDNHREISQSHTRAVRGYLLRRMDGRRLRSVRDAL